jgi:hypothetical protein
MQLGHASEERFQRCFRQHSTESPAASRQLQGGQERCFQMKEDNLTVNNKDMYQAGITPDVQEMNMVLRQAHDRAILGDIEVRKIRNLPCNRCRGCCLESSHVY